MVISCSIEDISFLLSSHKPFALLEIQGGQGQLREELPLPAPAYTSSPGAPGGAVLILSCLDPTHRLSSGC